MRDFIPNKKEHRKRDKALNTVLNAVDKRTAQCNA